MYAEILYFNLYRQERLWVESIRKWNIYEIMSRVRLDGCERNASFMPSEARLKICWKKYNIRALKFTVLLLNCTLGPRNLEVRGGDWAPGPPGSASAQPGMGYPQSGLGYLPGKDLGPVNWERTGDWVTPPSPPVDSQTDTCKNITSRRTTYAGGKNISNFRKSNSKTRDEVYWKTNLICWDSTQWGQFWGHTRNICQGAIFCPKVGTLWFELFVLIM